MRKLPSGSRTKKKLCQPATASPVLGSRSASEASSGNVRGKGGGTTVGLAVCTVGPGGVSGTLSALEPSAGAGSGFRSLGAGSGSCGTSCAGCAVASPAQVSDEITGRIREVCLANRTTTCALIVSCARGCGNCLDSRARRRKRGNWQLRLGSVATLAPSAFIVKREFPSNYWFQPSRCFAKLCQRRVMLFDMDGRVRLNCQETT